MFKIPKKLLLITKFKWTTFGIFISQFTLIKMDLSARGYKVKVLNFLTNIADTLIFKYLDRQRHKILVRIGVKFDLVSF